MTAEATEVHLLDVASGEPVTAELWDAITEEQLADWEGEWVPELFRAMQRLRRAAVALSEELKFHGRIELHSLPQANGFYANTCGMTDLGTDPDHEGLRYFEMSPENAQAFIAKGRSK
ncbi:MAG: hypothetical protein OXF26_08660 [Alphaproteobacteria bacterium]|nr:hypothetical protein [Alphaproteobacteria bacterium]MCY4319012.1 hypothetical protein [Alphaproteobacteria bacterium]